jgi:hypothetical protein
MSLFDLFRAPAPHHEPNLGSLLYSRGKWRGTVELESGHAIPLFLPGTRQAPLSEAVQVARHAGDWWTRARPDVARELFDHYSNGRDAGIPDLPDIPTPNDVWPHVTLSSVEVKPHSSLDEFMVAIRTAWDDEHTLGALVGDGTLLGLNGSIVEPR